MRRNPSAVLAIAGILAGSFPVLAGAATELVTNGGFDSGTSGWSPSQVDGFSWSFLEGNPGGALVLNNAPGPVPQAAQAIAGLIVGATYEISFDAKSHYNCCNTTLTPGAGVGVDGQQFDFFIHNDQAWTHGFFDFTYGGGSNILVLSAQRNGTDADGMFDNVSMKLVSGVPEPETYSMLLVGLSAVGFFGRRKARRT